MGKSASTLLFPDRTNTLYVASERLSLPGKGVAKIPGSGVFEFVESRRRLTREGTKRPSEWSLPPGFLPKGRPPLSYHGLTSRWSECGDGALLSTVARGQEFVLDLELYPELIDWLADVIVGGLGG